MSEYSKGITYIAACALGLMLRGSDRQCDFYRTDRHHLIFRDTYVERMLGMFSSRLKHSVSGYTLRADYSFCGIAWLARALIDLSRSICPDSCGGTTNELGKLLYSRSTTLSPRHKADSDRSSPVVESRRARSGRGDELRRTSLMCVSKAALVSVLQRSKDEWIAISGCRLADIPKGGLAIERQEVAGRVPPCELVA